MNGIIDSNGRALINVDIRRDAIAVNVEVWVDTGFTGDIVLPQPKIDALGLHRSGSVDAILADGSKTVYPTCTCLMDWFGDVRRLEVVANEGTYPLLGVGLLLGLELCVNYSTLQLTLEVA
ncbi:MAG: hypothetical protein CMJ78_10985 [Planctomycetaceae bacterium]|nr:hypothetical protein [Planctomycetaceae bacterium]